MAGTGKASGGNAARERTVRDRVKALVKFALEKGAYRAKAFSARSVVVDERVRLKCQIPLCPHFNKTLTCPPNVPGVEEFRTALRRYQTAMLVQTQAPITMAMDAFSRSEVLKFLEFPGAYTAQKGDSANEERKNLEDVKLQSVRLHKLVNEVEAQAMSLGFHYALGLIGGECMLCPKCVGTGGESGCRRPYQARPSMEGVGIDVVQTSLNAGLPFDIPPKHEVVWSGLVLLT